MKDKDIIPNIPEEVKKIDKKAGKFLYGNNNPCKYEKDKKRY